MALFGGTPQEYATAQSPSPVLSGKMTNGLVPSGAANFTNAYMPTLGGNLFAPTPPMTSIPNAGLSYGASNPLAGGAPSPSQMVPSGVPSTTSTQPGVIPNAGGGSPNQGLGNPLAGGSVPNTSTDPNAPFTNTPYNGLNPALAGFSQTAGAANPPGYYQQPLSDVISGTGYNTSPTFSTYLQTKLAGVKAESPGAIAGDMAASSQSGGGPNGTQPTGWDSWTPAAQWAYDYGTTHPDAPEVQQAGSLTAFANAYNDPSKYSWQALSGYSPAQIAAAPTGTTYGGGASYAGQSATTGQTSPVSPQLPTQPAVPSTPSTPVTPTNTNTNPLAGLGITDAQYQQLASSFQSQVGTTSLGYTQYQQPATSGITQQQLLGLIAALSGQNQQQTQQVPFWYL